MEEDKKEVLHLGGKKYMIKIVIGKHYKDKKNGKVVRVLGEHRGMVHYYTYYNKTQEEISFNEFIKQFRTLRNDYGEKNAITC